MSRGHSPELAAMLEPFAEETRALALATREVVLSYAPGSVELLYDSYNAVAIAFSTTTSLRDAFCHVAVYSRHVNLGFNDGAALDDPRGLLEGTGKRIRHVRISGPADLDESALRELIRAAVPASCRRVTAEKRPTAVVRARSARRRRPG